MALRTGPASSLPISPRARTPLGGTSRPTSLAPERCLPRLGLVHPSFPPERGVERPVASMKVGLKPDSRLRLILVQLMAPGPGSEVAV
jgi:hypothetical protein